MAPNSVASRVRFIQKLSPRLWATILLLTFFISRPKRNLATLTAIFRRLFGIGTVTLTSAQKTVLLKLKLSSSTKENVSLRELVEGIISPVRLNPLMFNGHVQTMAVATGKGGADPHIYYKRKEWESDSKFYPGHFTTDFVVPTPKKPTPRDRNLPPRTHDFTDEDWTDFISSDNNKPLVILMHGFMGGSHEKYIRHALDDLTAGGKGTELSAVVVNARGCSYSRLTSGTLYHPRATWDIRQFVRWAKKQWPQRKLFAVGFSVGANMLCNYLGEEGDACELDAAVLIGNPWSLDINNAILCQSILGRELYQRSLGTSFKKGFERYDTFVEVKKQ
jgi:predicted alpha/beta-fold hydrolase